MLQQDAACQAAVYDALLPNCHQQRSRLQLDCNIMPLYVGRQLRLYEHLLHRLCVIIHHCTADMKQMDDGLQARRVLFTG